MSAKEQGENKTAAAETTELYYSFNEIVRVFITSHPKSQVPRPRVWHVKHM